MVSLLQQQARDLFDLALTVEQVALFDQYHDLLVDWNTRMNLTAIIEPDAVRVRHFLDSLSLTRVVDFAKPLQAIDVGTGAGFPGLPLAMVYPNITMTLMDSTGKKVRFLQHIIDTFGLSNTQAVQSRAEDAGRDTVHREQYDLVLARAVARMPALLEYTLPLAKVGGRVIAMKGTTAHRETEDASRALMAFGGKLTNIEQIDLPDIDQPHYLVCVDKIGRTPPEFPRRAGIPTREPLL
jgi:16S rRNA (guanine527-N7)-methyltransferase